MRLAWWIVAILMAVGFCAGCRGDAGKDASPTPVEFFEDVAERDVAHVVAGDAVNIEVYVYHAKHYVLREENPVEVYPPAEGPFRFAEPVYRLNTATRVFPIVVPMTVPTNTKEGDYVVKLGMRLFYSSTADNEPQTRVEMPEVRVTVHQRTTATRHEVRHPMEYMLE